MNDALTDPELLTPMTPLPTGVEARGRLRLPIGCLLCDIYGTLFISAIGEWATMDPESHPIKSKLAALLTAYGFTVSPAELWKRLHANIAIHHARLKADGHRHPEVKIEVVWRDCLEFENAKKAKQFAVNFEAIINPVWPMPHLLELLNYCRRSGIQLGIISNAQFYTPLVFQQAFNRNLKQLGFDPKLIIFSYQYGIAKPDPRLFAMVQSQLLANGIPAWQTAYIGNDVRNDMLPARQAGFQTILFAGDQRSLRLRQEDPCCAEFQADLVVTGLDQVLERIKSIETAI